jgi:hypothetical protein
MKYAVNKNSLAWVGGVAALLLIVAGSALAKDSLFEIRSASSRLDDGVWFVTARVDLGLSEEAIEALKSGVVLPIQMQIKLTRGRKWWPDKEIATLEQSYHLSYQPLSERYVVKNLNSGEQDSFATLFSAMNTMGRVIDLPVIDASLLEAGEAYEIALRAVLDQNTLPGPLRLIAFWSDGFRLASDWYSWKLNG